MSHSLPCDIQGIFGRNLRNERYKNGISQEELAEMAGCSVDTVKRYERGCTGMKLDIAWHLAAALNIPLGSLLPKHVPETSGQLLAAAEDLIRRVRQME